MKELYEYFTVKRAKEAAENALFLFADPWERTAVAATSLVLMPGIVAIGVFTLGFSFPSALYYLAPALLLGAATALLIAANNQSTAVPDESRFQTIYQNLGSLNPLALFRGGGGWGGWDNDLPWGSDYGGWGTGYIMLRVLMVGFYLLTSTVCNATSRYSRTRDTTGLWVLLGLVLLFVVFLALPLVLSAISSFVAIAVNALVFAPGFLYRNGAVKRAEHALRQHLASLLSGNAGKNPGEAFAPLLEEAEAAFANKDAGRAVAKLDSLLLFVLDSAAENADAQRLTQTLDRQLGLAGLGSAEYLSRLKKLLRGPDGVEQEWAFRLALLKFNAGKLTAGERQSLLRVLYPRLQAGTVKPVLVPFLRAVFRGAGDVESWEKMKADLGKGIESREWEIDLKEVLWAQLKTSGLHTLIQAVCPEETTGEPLAREEVQRTVEAWKTSRLWTYRQLSSALEASDWGLDAITAALLREIVLNQRPDAQTLCTLASLVYHCRVDLDFVDFSLFVMEFAFHTREAARSADDEKPVAPVLAEKVKETGIEKARDLLAAFRQEAMARMGRAIQAPLLQERGPAAA